MQGSAFGQVSEMARTKDVMPAMDDGWPDVLSSQAGRAATDASAIQSGRAGAASDRQGLILKGRFRYEFDSSQYPSTLYATGADRLPHAPVPYFVSHDANGT